MYVCILCVHAYVGIHECKHSRACVHAHMSRSYLKIISEEYL